MFIEGKQIHNVISSSDSGTVINLGSSFNSDFLTSYGSYDSTTLPAKWRPQALLAELPC
jgi:hypothetical protein